MALNFISLNERGNILMKERLLKNSKNIKIKLSKEQQVKMLEFFAKSSIPRMLQPTDKEVK